LKLRKHSLLFLGNLIFFIVIAALVLAPVWKRRGSGNLRGFAALLPTTARAAEMNPWTLAVEKVKEDRGEPIGKQAKVETPSQLRHYSDTRRFLATQVAEVNEHHVDTPQDFVELARMINRGELVQLAPASENYILFGVGGSADSGPFTRYENGKSIKLYNEIGLRQEYDRLARSVAGFDKQIASFRQQLAGLKRRERSQRTRLQTQITDLEKELKGNREDKAQLDRYYGNADIRQGLFSDYESLQQLGAKLVGNAFDLGEANARRQLKVRMLSSMRPEALKVLEEIAASYHEKFGRPLPLTSLVRPDEYQQDLSKTNPNATRIETPPHSTGLAFDILYHYMTAAEQSQVMAELAQLKDQGRIEVLRENRDHYHVFAFVGGERPQEKFISTALSEVRSGKVANTGKATDRTAKSTEVRTAKAVKSHTAQGSREAHHAQKKSAAKGKANRTRGPRRKR
jgi:hypothetical protein